MPKGKALIPRPKRLARTVWERHRGYEEIMRMCRIQRVPVDTSFYKKGGDCIVMKGPKWHVIYDTHNGRFFGKTPTGVSFSSDETRYDSQKWMHALLHFFFVQKEDV